ncbi:hypothetical protein OIV83_001152 [Microbotryomycetes sp. JL201]|nr:hypothetical protein OIV83_001152 [Microbotryomycetes sp. JL201]
MPRSGASASAKKGASPLPKSSLSSSKTANTLLSYFSAVPAPVECASSVVASTAARRSGDGARAPRVRQQPSIASVPSAAAQATNPKAKVGLCRSQSALVSGSKFSTNTSAPTTMGNQASALLRATASASAVLTTAGTTPPRRPTSDEPPAELAQTPPQGAVKQAGSASTPEATLHSAPVTTLASMVSEQLAEVASAESSPVPHSPPRILSDTSSVVNDSQELAPSLTGFSSSPTKCARDATQTSPSLPMSPGEVESLPQAQIVQPLHDWQTTRHQCTEMPRRLDHSDRSSPRRLERLIDRETSTVKAFKSPQKAGLTETTLPKADPSPVKSLKQPEVQQMPARATFKAQDVFHQAADSSPLSSILSSPTASAGKYMSGSPSKRKPHSFSLVVPVRRRTASIEPVRRSPKKMQLDPLFSDSDDEERGLRDSMQVSSAVSPCTPNDHESDESNVADEEEEEDDVAELLARAKGRIAKGETLTTPAPAAALTAIDQGETNGTGRGSFTLRKRGTVDGTATKPVKVNLPKLQRSQAIARMARDRRELSSGMWDYAKQLLKSTSDDESNESESESGTGPSALTSDKLEALVRVAGDIINDEDAEYAAYAGSPHKRQQQNEATQRAANIADALKFDLAKQSAGDGNHRHERKVWRNRAPRPAWQDGAEMALAPWTQALERVISAGRADPRMFPPALTLWAQFRQYITNPETRWATSAAARRLMLFALHPGSPDGAANRAMAMVERMLMYTHNVNEPLISLDDVKSAFHALGMREELLFSEAEGLEGKTTPSPQLQEGSTLWTKKEREICLTRLLRLVRAVANTSLQGFSSRDAAALCSMLVSCALEPDSACQRKPIEEILNAILNCRGNDRPSDIDHALFRFLVERYCGAPAKIRFEILLALPSTTTEDNVLRRQLALTYLEPGAQSADEPDLDCDPSNHIRRLTRLLLDRAGPFGGIAETDAVTLYYNALTLSVALSCMSASFRNHKEGLLLDDFAQALIRNQDRIRADVRSGEPLRQRAKNVLNRIAYAVVYRRRTAQGFVAGIDFGIDDDKHKAKKSKVSAVPSGPVNGQKVLSDMWSTLPAAAGDV